MATPAKPLWRARNAPNFCCPGVRRRNHWHGLFSEQLRDLRGSILDPQRHPNPKVHVRIVAEDNGVERDAMSDATGLYGIEHERNTSQLLERFAIERTL